MLIDINLLPWREDQLRKQNQRFLVIVGTIVILMILAIVIAQNWLVELEEHQLARNDLLYRNIAIKKIDNKRLDTLQALSEHLNGEINNIQQIRHQQHRDLILFQELPNIMPEQSYLEELIRTESTIQISGIAKNPADIAQFIKRLAKQFPDSKPQLKLSTLVAEAPHHQRFIIAIHFPVQYNGI